MISRWFLVAPVALVAWACGDKASSSDSGGGGTGPSGGSAGAGTSGTSGTSGSSGSGGSTSCTFTVTKSVSERIPTVGIVEFSTDLAGMTDARIEFGRDTSYGMTAPVDLTEPNYRTLLLGMKPTTTYHFRIVATGPDGSCTGDDQTIETGARANALPTLTVNTMNAAELSGGFLMTAQYQGSSGDAPAYIIDADGDYVWWFIAGGQQKASARMSYDGKHMWIQNANVPETQGATVHRVSMDGLTVEDFSDDFAGANHQFTVLPDETIIFYAYGENGCDDIKERSPTGEVRTIVNSLTAQGLTSADCENPMSCCHVNHVEYSPMDDTVVFSDLDHNSYTKVRRNGEVVWVLGGPGSDFTGMPTEWQRQHGIDVIGLDRFVFFNNGAATSGPSVAIEILLDLEAMTATRPWTYTPTGVMNTVVMGDVQRMDNGNTVVAYSTRGVLHEVNPAGQLVQEISWPSGGAYGYIIKRPTLYGPPPR